MSIGKSFKNLLQNNRQRINQDLADIQQRKFFSPALYLLTQKILKALEKHAHGRLIDIGCGDTPFRNQLPPAVVQYDTLDLNVKRDDITYIGSVMDMHMIKDASYDSAMCFEVLEHVPNPFIAIREINRILKNDGLLIISVPHMWPIHEAPHDYLRFTYYGLKHILQENQFKIVSMENSGGILTYIGHNVTSLILCLVWGVPILKHLVFFLVKWLIVLPCAFIDDKVIRSEMAPLEYLCIAKKVPNNSYETTA